MNRKLLIIILLSISTLAVYWKAGNLEFVMYDDPGYVAQNHRIIQGLSVENIYWAFTTLEMSNWHPLTWLSYLLDGQMYGLNPRGYHLTNVFLHIANTLILFIFLNRTTGAIWRSAFVAALFALHPLHVESVAWVSERKDVLSTLFFMLSLLAYVSYVERPRPARYLLVMVAFTLSLMVKPMLVTFPFILLLLDYWPLKRYQSLSSASRITLEKIPFGVLSLASMMITIYAQHAGGSMSSMEKVPLIPRVENAIVAYARYIAKTLWPSELIAFYPFSVQIPILQLCGALIVLLLISLIAYRRRLQYPFFIVGWLWFLGTLLPVIGLVQVGSQSMADRYTYVPLIGLFVIAGWGSHSLLAEHRHLKKAAAVSAFLMIVGLSVVSWLQIDHWKNSRELVTHALQYSSGNYIMHNNMGILLEEEGKHGEAIVEFEKAVHITPHFKRAHYNLGNVLLQTGNTREAINHYQEALRIDPNYLKARYNLGAALVRDGKYDEAISQYYEILKISPDYEDVHKLLGIQLASRGRIEEAILQFSEILKYNPHAEDAHYDLSVLFASRGKTEEAIMHLSRALRKPPADQIVANEVHRYHALARDTVNYEYMRNLLR